MQIVQNHSWLSSSSSLLHVEYFSPVQILVCDVSRRTRDVVCEMRSLRIVVIVCEPFLCAEVLRHSPRGFRWSEDKRHIVWQSSAQQCPRGAEPGSPRSVQEVRLETLLLTEFTHHFCTCAHKTAFIIHLKYWHNNRKMTKLRFFFHCT